MAGAEEEKAGFVADFRWRPGDLRRLIEDSEGAEERKGVGRAAAEGHNVCMKARTGSHPEF